MKPILAFLLVTIFFVAGCDSMNWQQYRIAGVVAGSTDAAKLRTVLQVVADKSGLKDRTPESRVPGTLLLYEQPDVQHFRVDIGARFYRDDVLIDLLGGIGPTTPAYKQAKRLLEPALFEEFGSRLSIQPDHRRFVPVP